MFNRQHDMGCQLFDSSEYFVMVQWRSAHTDRCMDTRHSVMKKMNCWNDKIQSNKFLGVGENFFLQQNAVSSVLFLMLLLLSFMSLSLSLPLLFLTDEVNPGRSSHFVQINWDILTFTHSMNFEIQCNAHINCIWYSYVVIRYFVWYRFLLFAAVILSNFFCNN